MIPRLDSRKKGFRPWQNLWLVLVLIVCLGTCVVAVNSWSLMRGMDSQSARLCDSASAAYRQDGAAELKSALEVLEQGVGIRVLLSDKNGRDLVSGEDVSGTLKTRPGRPLLPFLGPPAAIPISSPVNGLCTIQINPRIQMGLPPEVLFLPLLSLVCCSVAAYITLRMRSIETAVERFGSGAMGVRIDAYSTDPMGRLARAFNQMAERIESLVEGNRRLYADMSHELRSPLARLRLAVGLARSGARGALDRMETEILRLDDLVDTLLDTARAEADSETLRSEAVSIRDLLLTIADDCAIEAKARQCELNVEAEGSGSVAGDPELLRSALENILRNAIRHNPVGLPIDIRAQRDGSGAVHVSVRDYGTGVPFSALERIFQPFYRVESDRDRSTGGTGLGLAIAKRIISVHGGSAKAENAGPGLRVEVCFPRQ
jgi:signal transduction histidine kinase